MKTTVILSGIPIWLTVTVLSRDLIVLMGMALIHYMIGKAKVRARMERQNFDHTAHGHGLVDSTGLEPPGIALHGGGGGIFYGVSGVFYILDGVRQLNSHPASGPAPSQDFNFNYG